MNRSRSTLSATSLVLAGPEGWCAAVERVIADDQSLAIVANVECNPREVDIRAIPSGEVVLIAVDGDRPNDAIEFAMQLQAKDRGTSIVLVLPNMSRKNLLKIHTYAGSWSMISAAACIDHARLIAVLGSAGRGIPWIDPIITRLLKTFVLGPEDFDEEIGDSSIDDFIRDVRPSDQLPDQEPPSGKILVVDDNDGIRLALELILEMAGHEVVTAMDGAEAIRLAQSDVPDLILLDVMMPVMDGVETLKILKSLPSTQSIPVIMVTAKAGSDDLATAREFGALDYITKPWLDGEVESSVTWALSRLTPVT